MTSTTAIEYPTTDTPAIDPQALDAFMCHTVTQATAAVNALLVGLGDQLGLWKTLADGQPTSAAGLAARTGLAQRYLEEWLAAQAANGFLVFDASNATFRLTPEAAMVLAIEDSPASVIAAFQGMALVARMLPTLERAFRSGDGIAWGDHDNDFFDVQARFSRPMQLQFLIDTWLRPVPGLIDTLEKGASVADVGCGYGASTILLARAFPASRFKGFDFHDVSIANARRAARDAGVAHNVEFETADARSFPGSAYDAVLLIDCLHDMGDPVAVARHARGALKPGGALVVVDSAAADSLAENLQSPMAGLMYPISTFLCTPTALAQHGPHALGAMAGEAAMRRLLREAGFSDVQRVAPEAPMHMVLVATN
jgi:ubiquinone/menaquinone biosynthesis C-methylase UbiE